MRLFYHPRLYDLAGTEALFMRAIADNVRHHIRRCPEYAEILRLRDFSPDSLTGTEDLGRLPPITTLFLKRRALYSAPKERLILKSTTSGTSGRVGFMGLDLPTSLHGIGMIATTFLTHRLPSPRLTNYAVLGYEPAKHNKIGAARTAYAMTFSAPALRREYALRDTGDAYESNLDALCDALARYAKQNRPVRFIGFPAYFMFLLKELQKRGLRMRLHPRSLVILAGGWKQFFAERIEKPELYALSEETVGLGGSRIREFFGAVEHPIAYCDCANHHFHVPIYSRVLIRDVNTLEPVGYGVPGLLNLITPMVTSMPFSSVITDDIATLYPGESCGCGVTSPYFEIEGRVGMADIKTCAAGAAELLSDLVRGSAE
jgi:phenylacetate-coenzyme A ligase PaaK-like adenylate-forming protein